MKSGFWMCVGLCLFLTSNAQITANDSAITGSGNTEMVYYQLSTGNKTSTSNTDWHLAITVRATNFPSSPLGGTSIRINEANGVKAYYVPNADVSGFNSLDTTGWQGWTTLHDSDTSIDEGALNSNRNRSVIYDFGWGMYSPVTHNVTGDSLYLIQLPNGSLKKLVVVILRRDTAFDIRFSNIDNSDLQLVHISKKDYIGKQFVYLDLGSATVRDKEPPATNWDLQFLRYAATDVLPDTTFPVTGVWLNQGTRVAKAQAVDINTVDYSSYAFSDTNLNAIGWNWKYYDVPNSMYVMVDSLVYFVKSNNGHFYKIVFTEYSQSAPGVVGFYKQTLTTATALNVPTPKKQLKVYPNPANNVLHVTTDGEPVVARLTDINSRTVQEQRTDETELDIDTNQLPDGIYFLTILSAISSWVSKIIIHH